MQYKGKCKGQQKAAKSKSYDLKTASGSSWLRSSLIGLPCTLNTAGPPPFPVKANTAANIIDIISNRVQATWEVTKCDLSMLPISSVNAASVTSHRALNHAHSSRVKGQSLATFLFLLLQQLPLSATIVFTTTIMVRNKVLKIENDHVTAFRAR